MPVRGRRTSLGTLKHKEQQKLNAAPLRSAPVNSASCRRRETSERFYNKSLPGGRHLKSLECDPNKLWKTLQLKQISATFDVVGEEEENKRDISLCVFWLCHSWECLPKQSNVSQDFCNALSESCCHDRIISPVLQTLVEDVPFVGGL